jgi:hypothetical protein
MSILRQHLPEMQCGGTIEKDKLILLKMRIKYYIQLILAFSTLLLTGCTSQNALNTSTTLDTKAHFENSDAAFEDAHDDSIFQVTEPDPYWGVPLEAIRSLEDIPIYQGKDLGIADISILSNRLSFSVANFTPKDYYYGYSVKLFSKEQGDYREVMPYKTVNYVKDYMCLTSEKKITLTLPFFYDMREGHYLLLLDIYDPESNQYCFLPYDFEITSDGSTLNTNAPNAAEKNISFSDQISINSEYISITDFSITSSGISVTIKNNGDQMYYYGSALRILQSDNSFHKLVYPRFVEHFSSEDILLTIPAKSERQITQPLVYSLAEGEYLLQVPLFDTTYMIPYYIRHNFTIKY